MKPKRWALLFVFAGRLCGQTAAPGPLLPEDKSSWLNSRNAISKDESRIPTKAVKELQRSLRDYSSGNIRSSARHLEKALQLYPNYWEAQNNLGARYIELHEYEKAVAQFQKAIQIDPRAAQPFNNLSVAFFLLQRYPEAESAARRALDLDPQDSTARYVLGCTLVSEDRNPLEAIALLRETVSVFPDSRLLITKILVRHGNLDDAKKELRDYLTMPGIEKRAIAEGWLAQLTRTP